MPYGTFAEFQAAYLQNKRECLGRCKNADSFFYYRCRKCRQNEKQLCRVYHSNSPCDELILRLLYETLCSKVTLDAVKNKKWLREHKRDWGHQQRIENLWHQAQYDSRASWLREASVN